MSDNITLGSLLEFKSDSRKIAAVSCYDYTTAGIVEQAGVEMVIVGDSAAQIMLGYDSTLPATMDFMVAITAAVRRGAGKVFLVGDMPFLSYQPSISQAVKNAGRFFVEAGVQMVKIEATGAYLDVITAVSDAGMSVMAHIGMRPQSGKLKAEGATAQSAVELIGLAQRMIDAGASALLLEGIAREVAKVITERSDVPVISCGSGPDCDGQVLVVSDIIGTTKGAKFSKPFGEVSCNMSQALTEYANQVKTGAFPDDDHCYHVRRSERDQFDQMLKTLDQ